MYGFSEGLCTHQSNINAVQRWKGWRLITARTGVQLFSDSGKRPSFLGTAACVRFSGTFPLCASNEVEAGSQDTASNSFMTLIESLYYNGQHGAFVIGRTPLYATIR